MGVCQKPCSLTKLQYCTLAQGMIMTVGQLWLQVIVIHYPLDPEILRRHLSPLFSTLGSVRVPT